jgi:hypothetical protein
MVEIEALIEILDEKGIITESGKYSKSSFSPGETPSSGRSPFLREVWQGVR